MGHLHIIKGIDGGFIAGCGENIVLFDGGFIAGCGENIIGQIEGDAHCLRKDSFSAEPRLEGICHDSQA